MILRRHKPMRPSFILWILFPVIVFGADCPACPTGGIWSEWAAPGTCKSSCGACSNMTYTRTCLSTGIANCACSGPTAAVKLCGTQACNYPRANGPTPPCCVGTPTIMNNWYHCGPLEQKSTSGVCCPTGGIWSDWSAWGKVNGKPEFTRTRECISSGFQCQCVGDYTETKYSCACEPLKLLIIRKGDTRCNYGSYLTYTGRTPQNHRNSCKATFLIETSDFADTFYRDDTDHGFVTAFGYINAAGQCIPKYYKTPDNTGTKKYDAELYPINFACNYTTGLWDGYNDYLKEPIVGISEIAQFFGKVPD